MVLQYIVLFPYIVILYLQIVADIHSMSFQSSQCSHHMFSKPDQVWTVKVHPSGYMLLGKKVAMHF